MNLFGRSTSSREPDQIETVIGPSANLRGTLQSDGGVRVDGVFEGIIETAGNVVIGEGAKVVADISARNVTVGGAVKGNVEATGRLEILSTGIVYGDMQVQSVMIDEGGQFHGVSRMRGLDHPALAPPEDHRPKETSENGAVDLRLDNEPLDVTARHRETSKPASVVVDDEAAPDEPAAVSELTELSEEDEFELQLDDLDLDFDMDIDPIIPDSQPERSRASRRRR